MCLLLLLGLPGGLVKDAVAADPWPLGNFTLTSGTASDCPVGYTCSGFSVSCSGITADARGYLAVAAYRGAPRGVIMFFTGNDGGEFWSNWGSPTYAMAEELRSLGYTIVQLKWVDNWLESSPGNDAGTAHLACRPATVIKYVHEKYYLSMHITNRISGVPGFGITGNSGGASQISYALSYYGLDRILDVVVPTGGPPHAALAKSCMTNANEQEYWFAASTLDFIDRGFGWFDGAGPAARHDPAERHRWLEESVATGGTSYYHPTTRIHFVVGDGDPHNRTISGDYFQRLRSAGSPFLTYEIALQTPHAVHSTEAGRAAIKMALLGMRLTAPLCAGNQLRFSVPGVTNYSSIVQSSINLQNWIPVYTNRGSFTFTDDGPIGAPGRFYRVVYQP